MKHILISIVLVSLISCAGDKANKPQDAKTGNDYGSFKIKRGTNIAHWLSQSEKTGAEREGFFTEKDVQYIAHAGFDHMRLPVDEQQLWDSGGKRYSDAFQLLDNFMNWANKAGLRVVLDLHILRSHHFNEAEKPLWTKPEAQDKFIQLWKDLASAVNKWPNGMIAYEFMNEPVADDPEQWNRLLARVADSIRSWEPERTLVIGSNKWQSVNTFDQLKIPANDKNILLSFHFYEPFYLTHYKASWTKLKDFNGTVQYPGQVVVNGDSADQKQVYNRDTLEQMMAKPIHLADSLKLPLYCGEFGVIDGSPRASKEAWYRDLVAIFDKHNIAYANWNFKSGSFGIVNDQLNPDTPMVNILTGKKE
ncbi:MAG TPA: cellulase family glycosylhydrolase [Flavitalea sp.]|nr:cellulase family glycosylhydrolase [Flavitalea sp.]